MKKTLGEKIIKFNSSLHLDIPLPANIRVLDPLKNNPEILHISKAFYSRFYNNNDERKLILGINPGRLGAGATGIPFTDSKRLLSHCGIKSDSVKTHEPSSVFVYDVIDRFGGAEAFYGQFYITSICPLGFVKISETGKELNFNYYDDKTLMRNIKPFVVDCLKRELKWEISRDIAFCFGTGKNFKFIEELNNEFHFFKRIIPLEHPRYIMQYKSAEKEKYIKHYLSAFNS